MEANNETSTVELSKTNGGAVTVDAQDLLDAVRQAEDEDCIVSDGGAQVGHVQVIGDGHDDSDINISILNGDGSVEHVCFTRATEVVETCEEALKESIYQQQFTELRDTIRGLSHFENHYTMADTRGDGSPSHNVGVAFRSEVGPSEVNIFDDFEVAHIGATVNEDSIYDWEMEVEEGWPTVFFKVDE